MNSWITFSILLYLWFINSSKVLNLSLLFSLIISKSFLIEPSLIFSNNSINFSALHSISLINSSIFITLWFLCLPKIAQFVQIWQTSSRHIISSFLFGCSLHLVFFLEPLNEVNFKVSKLCLLVLAVFNPLEGDPDGDEVGKLFFILIKFLAFSFCFLSSIILWSSFIKALFIGKESKEEIFSYSVESSGHFNTFDELIEFKMQLEHIVCPQFNKMRGMLLSSLYSILHAGHFLSS